MTWTSRAHDVSLSLGDGLRPGCIADASDAAEGGELGELRGVRGVGDAPGPKAVAERQRDVVGAADLQDRVEGLVERVLPAVVDHPAREQPAAARHDAGDAVLAEGQVLEADAGVDGHVVDALARLVLDHLEQQAGGEVLRARDALDRLVDRHRPDRHRGALEDRLARLVDALARGQVHHRVGAPALGEHELRHLLVER
jgi:hypothetical protein